MIEELTTLALTNTNLVSIIDKDNFENLSKFKWHLSTKGYVVRTVHGAGFNCQQIKLHNEVFGNILTTKIEINFIIIEVI